MKRLLAILFLASPLYWSALPIAVADDYAIPTLDKDTQPVENPSLRQNRQPAANQNSPSLPEEFNSADPLAPTNDEISDMKISMLSRLAKKLIEKDGTPVPIVVLDPLDSTRERVGHEIVEVFKAQFARYGEYDFQVKNEMIKSLSLIELRRNLHKFHAKILLVPVISDTTFDLYLYDKRSPTKLFAHTEVLSNVDQLKLTQEVAATYARLLLRRALYRYIRDEYFELPDQISAPFLQNEIPKWVASQRSLAMVNRESLSNFYVSLEVGAALSIDPAQEVWNSDLIGAELGVRIVDNFFLEAQAKAFSYNAFTGSAKYLFTRKDSPFRLLAGIGYSYVTSKKVWNLDQTEGLGQSTYYVTPSLTLLFPIGDVYLKAEAQFFYGMGNGNNIFTIAPGLLIHF